MDAKKGILFCDAGVYAGSLETGAEEIGYSRGRLWSIILAGGNGERISADIHKWMGRKVPKQYCAFVGTRSMLQHTIARADALGPREHQLTVVARSHQSEAQAQLADRPQGTVIVQPKNCDTLAGIFLPLTHVYARDPEAMVVIYPSDHFIYPEKAFIEMTAYAIRAAEELPDKLVLVGVPAQAIDKDYGWILPGSKLWESGDCLVRSVRLFMEKPSRADAAVIKESGGLWNTMIIAVKARSLWQLGLERFPEILNCFERLRNVIGTAKEGAVLDAIYEAMPSRNFSADLLARAANRVAVMPTDGIIWSDWGRMERIVETLDLVGRQPNFPMMLNGSVANRSSEPLDLKVSNL
jgi:mannose-1-phosphate guanylyltransferase